MPPQYLGPGNTLTGGVGGLFGNAGGGGVPGLTSQFATPDLPFSPGLSTGVGLGPLQANANVGLFQVPISASFLNPSATTTFDPTVYANPNVTQGPLSNSLILGPQFGGGQSSSASLFGLGGGGGKGGGGGNIADNINYSPTTQLVSNLPSPLQPAATPNLLTGGASQNVMRPQMMPAVPNQQGGALPFMTPPIAAGGIPPTLAGMMSLPQQQQMSPQTNIIPGSASQAGGYGPPPQQQHPMGAFPQQGGGLSPATMFPSPMAMSLLQQPPAPSQAPAAQALAQYPQLMPQQAQMDVAPSPLKAGAQAAVRPDPTLAASQQEMLQKQQALSGGPSAIADKAKQDYDKAIDDAWLKYQRDTAEPEADRATGEKATKTAMEDMQKLGTPDGLTAGRNKLLQNNVDALPKKLKDAYNRAQGTQQSGRMDKAMSLLHRLSRGVVAGFGETGLLYEDDLASAQAKAQDMAVYKAVQAETDKQMAEQIDLEKAAATQANRMATQSGADLTRLQTGYNQEQNQAYKSTIKAGTAAGAAISHESSILGHISNILRGGQEEENALVNQDLSRQRLAVSQGELGVNRGRLGVSQQAEARQERAEPSLLKARKAETAYKEWLTGSPAIAPPKGFPAPKTKGTEVSEYASGLRPLITSGRITKQQANDAIKYYQAQGMLSEEGE